MTDNMREKNKAGKTGMTKFEIASALQEISSLLRLKSGDPFRARAYAKAAQAVVEVEKDIATLIEQNQLTEIKGIGQSLAAAIEELYVSGRSSLLETLRAEVPRGASTLSQIPGLTLEKIEKLDKALGVSNIDDLKAAIAAGKLRELRGFGEKSESVLLERISRYENRDNRMLLVHALKIAEKVIAYMRTYSDLVYVDLAGSARRWKETVSTIRFTAAVSGDAGELIRHFLLFPLIAQVENQTNDAATARLIEGVTVRLFVATPDRYWNLLHRETGSAAHLKKLAGVAKEKGIELAPASMRLIGKRKILKVESEEDIYQHLGLQYVPPELREDIGEIEAALAHSIPDDLITIEDIKGMIHCHTTYSDGRNTVEEMALAAQSMGIKYMTITDHSPTAHYARGVEVDRLKTQWDEIGRVQERVSIKLLRGTESDILRDGSLDYPDRILEQFDVIIASIHNRYKLDEDQMTRRVIDAMKNPFFKVWGHPLGRLLQRRPPISCRVEEILDAIAEAGAAIEISGDPHRLDMEPRWTREARKRNIKFVVSTDAHSISDLENLKFGIGIARRAGVRRGEVLNALVAKDFLNSVCPVTPRSHTRS
ncbi:MAG TPA: DNA polymerase/3'-5' exonuclease PolX [Blastocatellia bacterium]|nr:DNA polymerase/3'-5' exonuclease PolX [Blastocatellia bacterium]